MLAHYQLAPVTENFSHDELAGLLGVPSKSFEETYHEKCVDMKRTVLEYVKTLHAVKLTGAGAGIGVQFGQGSIRIEQDSDGFPIAPSPASWEKITKDDLERLYRLYITQHYCMSKYRMRSHISSSFLGLASKDSERQAPFTHISTKQSDFIQAKYLPRGIIHLHLSLASL